MTFAKKPSFSFLKPCWLRDDQNIALFSLRSAGIMPSRCVAAGCSNCPSETVSVFKFPKDVKLRDIWTKQVQRTRAKWMPTSSSVLCSEHFERHCFNEIPQLKASLGFAVQHKRVLIPSAVPSIFVRSAEKPDKKMRKSKAAEKLATKRVKLWFVIHIIYLFTGSFITSQIAQPAATTSTCDQSQAPADCEAVSSEVQSTETSLQPCTRRHVRVQVSQTKLGTLKHKGSQTDVLSHVSHIGTQTEPLPGHCVTCGHQNDAVAAAGRDVGCDSPEPLDESDNDYLPSSADETDDSCSSEQQTPETNNVLDDTKYIVFWSSLLRLFKLVRCSWCGETGLKVDHNTNGTMLLVHFQCGVCSLATEWKSQPYIGKSLAGNIILSAGIPMSGAVPSKVLKVLHHMRVAGISSRTFSRHQNMMLFPAIKHVWLENRKWLVASLQAEHRGLMLGGDGRCDSPGHSAKFGSYAIMELVAKVIIDVELVQCNEVPSSCHMEKEGLKS
uniref:uncharacterized protein n=1 Tax=Myxine glutinosa TaxID=7769 RepID=UPI00358F5049